MIGRFRVFWLLRHKRLPTSSKSKQANTSQSGSPSMFRTCKLIEVLPRDLRFTLPGNDEKWRGKPLTGSSIRHYHHVQQNCSGRKPLATQNTEERRTFFLYVRRTQI